VDDLGWLMEEPFVMRPDEVAKLTDAQIMGLWGRPRDEKTGLPKPVGPEVQSLFESLRAWRAVEAKAQRIPPYVIFHDTVLRDIAAGKESTGDTTTLEDFSVLAKIRGDEE
jgi:superfamily II DNA helicase RecQ